METKSWKRLIFIHSLGVSVGEKYDFILDKFTEFFDIDESKDIKKGTSNGGWEEYQWFNRNNRLVLTYTKYIYTKEVIMGNGYNKILSLIWDKYPVTKNKKLTNLAMIFVQKMKIYYTKFIILDCEK